MFAELGDISINYTILYIFLSYFFYLKFYFHFHFYIIHIVTVFLDSLLSGLM
jgi:hypothetical protein